MEWIDSPCYRCEPVACCSHLPLHSFTINNREEWLRGRSLLDFPDMRLGLRSDGEFRVYLGRTCPFLTEERRCLLHDSPRQSRICRTYSPHTCWYKRAFRPEGSDLLILLDRARCDALERSILWGEGGEICRVPDWEDMKGLTAIHPLSIRPFRERTLPGPDTPAALLVPPGEPRKGEHWDLVRFRLGFPGVFLVRAGEGLPWAFLISADGLRPTPERLAAGGWSDPFLTGCDPAGGELISLKDLNRRQGL